MVEHSKDPSPRDDAGQDNAEGGVHSQGLAEERVAKALARAGVASRRDVERLIEAGRVALNGQVLKTPAVKVGAGDVLTVDGKPVSAAEPTRLWRYHKPTGLVTTHKDPHERPTVFQALPKGMPRVISIGRLDLNSEGLLLLTNNGDLARALELPSSGWVRRYRARARGRTDQAKLDTLKDGITIEGVRYGPIDARIDKMKENPDGVSSANVWITVALTEGKNREVRRVLEALGLTVNRLIRLSYGPFQLGVLGQGQVEEVGPRVIREQLVDFIAPENMPKGDHTPALAQPPAQARRMPGQGSGGALIETKTKPVYKAGWAKPKIKPSPHKPAKAGAKAVVYKGAPKKPWVKGGAKPGPAVISRDKPGQERPASRRPDAAARARPERSGPPKSRKGR
jgi:23S rRNA pseudouridine2605 synthase